ncbi:MAG: hypothetical protein ACT4QF_02905 [Sporichthyaceae bacterium]
MKLFLAGGVAAWVGSVPALALLAVLGGPGTAAGTPVAASAAVEPALSTAQSLVGARTGWYRLCDRLACRAYGYANSGYATALVHWQAMLAGGHAHAGDRCPPPGSFVFWHTAGPGHVAVVTASDAYCDPAHIRVVSNDVLDAEAGTRGGVYEVSLTRIETGFVRTERYLGWSDPVCAGARLFGAAA